MRKEMSGFSALPYTVIRIRGEKKSPSTAKFSGTGFFYSFEEGGKPVPLIISNKHVLCNSKFLEFDFATADIQHNRKFAPAKTIRFSENQIPIFLHPDPNVDLAAVPLQPILKQAKDAGIELYTVWLNESNFPSIETVSTLNIGTDIVMVGFPTGLMDEYNNLPVSRKGSLATPYVADYQGKTDFVIDIAAFGGSSGSPVFAVTSQFKTDINGNPMFAKELPIFLIGVLHSGPILKAHGHIVSVPAPTNFLMSETEMMIHLGICLKAARIKELCNHIENIFLKR